ncbi:MAG: LysR family transcriptional regulator [Ancalomicrobiaceae bacterium]|nr:LysR family transcriptional regulator [Ancalomicrobiaceae bacterium]
MDRLTSMSVFVKAAELGSFSAAAEALETSSQLVGKHVQRLEQHLGVRLLNRTTRRQSLTDIGRVFFERARNILAELEAAEALAAETRATPRGRLRVNAPVTFGIHALTPRLPDYLGRHPEVGIDLTMTNRYVDLVDEGFDAVFRVGQLDDSSLIARPLKPYRLILCASPTYLDGRAPLRTPADLPRHSCLGFSFGALRTHWEFDGPDGRISVPVTSRIMMDNGEALLAAARAGLGIMLQSSEMVQPEIEAGRLVSLLPEYRAPPYPFHLLYAPDRRLTPKLRSFIDFAAEVFG